MSKISQMPVASSTTGSELIEIIQNGVNKKIQLSAAIAPGATGPAGQSAYQIAVLNGFVGNQAAWLASLTGSAGNTGATGVAGPAGAIGKSAYEVAVTSGFVGTQAEWLASLKGDTGDRGNTGPAGAQGDEGPQGIQGIQGPAGTVGVTGKSAYEIAVLAGFVGNEAAWLNSLRGPTGNQGIQGIQGIQGPAGADGTNGTNGLNGKSAYEVATDNGFQGNEAAWLDSLIGSGGSAVDDTQSYVLRSGTPTQTVAVNQNVDYIRLVANTTVVGIKATLNTPSTTGAVVVDVNVNGVSILGASKLTIEQGEVSTFTTTNLPVIQFPDVRSDFKINIDVDSAGVGATGLCVILIVKHKTLPAIVAAPYVSTIPVISGSLNVGQVISVNTGDWASSPYAFTYEWFRDGALLTWSSGNSYTLVPADAGRSITARVTAANADGTGISTTIGNVIAIPLPVNLTIPTTPGSATKGKLVTAQPGTWLYGTDTYRYQWYRNTGSGYAAIVGATYAVYTFLEEDVSFLVRLGVIASNSTGDSAEYFSAPLLVAGSLFDEAWPPPMYDPTNLRDLSVPLTGTITTINVGPGQQHEELETVPWLSMTAGTTVNVFHRPTPYKLGAKMLLRVVATRTDQFTLNGVSDAFGNKPIIDGDGATTALDCRSPNGSDYVFSSEWTERSGLIQIIGRTLAEKPKWINILNLWVRNGGPGYSFTGQFGTVRPYFNEGGNIHIFEVEHFLLEDCWISGGGNGIFTNTRLNVEEHASYYVTLRRNCLWGNGYPARTYISYGLHDAYIQAGRTLYEGNYFGPMKDNSFGCQLKDRASATVFRYNWVDMGGVPQESSSIVFDSIDGGLGTVTADPLYPYAWVYGNVFRSDSEHIADFSWTNNAVWWAGAESDEEVRRGGCLYFYHNTFYMSGTSIDHGIWNKSFMTIYGSGATAEISNNIFWSPGDSVLSIFANGQPLAMLTTMKLTGTNWVSTGTELKVLPAPTNVVQEVTGTVLIGDDPLLDYASFQVIEGSPIIGTGMTVIEDVVAPMLLIENLQVTHQPLVAMKDFYNLRSNPLPIYQANCALRSPLGGASEIGAFETDTGIPAPPPPSTVALEPGVDGIFYWNVADGLDPFQVNNKWNRPISKLVVQFGALQVVNIWGSSKTLYVNGQGADQYASLKRSGSLFDLNNGDVSLLLNADITTGYAVVFSVNAIQIYRSGVYATGMNYSGTMNWSSETALSAKKVNGVLSVYANGVLAGTWTDPTPINTGNPGLSISTNGQPVSYHRVTEWTDNPF